MSLDGAQSGSRDNDPSALFRGADEPLHKLPRLGQVFEDIAANSAEAMSGLSSLAIDVAMSGARSGSAFDSISGFSGQRVVGRMVVEGWESGAVIVADREFLFTMLALLLGGDGAVSATMSSRPLTKIEKNIAGLLLSTVAKAVSDAFAGVAEVRFQLEDVSESIEYDVLGGEEADVVVAGFELKLQDAGGGGGFEIYLPSAMLEGSRQDLARPPEIAPKAVDHDWVRQIEAEIARSFVRLRAVLDEQKISLGQVADLKVGELLVLKATPESRVKVECNGEFIFWSRLGQSNGAYTLQIDEFVEGKDGVTRDLLKVS